MSLFVSWLMGQRLDTHFLILLILLIQFNSLVTKHSNIRACGGHFHSNYTQLLTTEFLLGILKNSWKYIIMHTMNIYVIEMYVWNCSNSMSYIMHILPQTTKISRFYKINTNYYWFNIHNLKSMKYKIVKFIVFKGWHDIMNRKFHAIKLFKNA